MILPRSKSAHSSNCPQSSQCLPTSEDHSFDFFSYFLLSTKNLGGGDHDFLLRICERFRKSILIMSKKRPKQPDISGFFTKIPKMSSDENASQDAVKSEESIEPKMEENQLDFSRNETQD